MTKKELRAVYRQTRNALTATERNKLDDLLLIQLQTAEIPFLQTLFSYWPIASNNEPATHLFSRYLSFQNPGLIIAYPRADFNTNTMVAVAVEDDTPFTQNSYGIYEPDAGEVIEPPAIDMVIVPMLAFDKKGYRVGYGRGFYDKFLAACNPSCIKAGFCYFEPVEAILGTDDFDVPLDLCITPHNVYVF